MLVVAAGGAAHILVRGYGLAAARARPPGGVQFVAFGIQAGLQEVFLRNVNVFSGFDTGQRKVMAFSRVVATWCLFLHCRPAFCCVVTTGGAVTRPPLGPLRFGHPHPLAKDAS